MPGTRRSSLVGAVLLVAPGPVLFSTPTFSRASIPGPYYLATACLADFLGSREKFGTISGPRDTSQAGGAWLSGGEIAIILASDHRRDCPELSDGFAQNARRRNHRPARIGTMQVHIRMPAGELKIVRRRRSKLMERGLRLRRDGSKTEIHTMYPAAEVNSMSTQPGRKFHIGP